MVEQDIRWQQRFSNFKKALSQLKKFIEKGELSELEEQGLIKAFEYTYELAWNTMKDFLLFKGQTEIYGSRDAVRKAFQLDLIEDGEAWMDMLKKRNLTTHTYNRDTAEEVVNAVVQSYYPLFLAFESKMNTMM
ncbi:MAG: nucleotidyltransferase substrate binding protein [Bacteroidetes bacterium]|nr:nucleotidyltransferase substrate binding protein [Bacteroidota bacterium]